MRNTICAALTALTLALCIALGGCGGTDASHDNATQCADLEDGISECTVTLQDTRKVDCLTVAGGHGTSGLSCDWNHASGTDKEPTR